MSADSGQRHYLRELLLVLVLLMTACSASEPAGSGSTGDVVEADPETAEPADPAAAEELGARAAVVGIPNTAVGVATNQMLSAVLDGSVTVEQVEQNLDELFLAEVSAEEFVTLSAQLPPLLSRSPVVTELSIDTEFTIAGTMLNPTDDTRWAFIAASRITEPHRLLQLIVQPEPEAEVDDSLADLEAVVEAWAALAPRTDLFVSELDPSTGAACPGGGETLAIGSAFKFYVLGAVATAVGAGTIAWDDELILVDEHYSLPSGQLQLEEPGTTLTVAQAAELMMAISDNTATDHLLALVGRDAVEAEQAPMGHESPQDNLPFFTTRELFQLKLGDPIRLGLVAAGDEDERRRLLGDLTGEPLPELSENDFTEPTALEVEWFASAGDLCRAIVDLDGRSEAHPPVLDAITSGSAVRLDPAVWPQVAFKGGSEPGVLSGTWLLTHADGRRFVVSAIANDPETDIDTVRAFAIVARAFELLGQ